MAVINMNDSYKRVDIDAGHFLIQEIFDALLSSHQQSFEKIPIGHRQWQFLKTLLSTVTKRNSEEKTL